MKIQAPGTFRGLKRLKYTPASHSLNCYDREILKLIGAKK